MLLKKILFFSLVFLVLSCSTGTKVVNSNKIKPGMTKTKVNMVLYVNAMMDQIIIPQSYREYFSFKNKEILGDDKGRVYYVFKNVTTPVSCGWLMCLPGNGYLEKTFFNYQEAVKFVTGDNKEKKKTITIVEDGKETEVSSDDEMMEKLTKLAED